MQNRVISITTLLTTVLSSTVVSAGAAEVTAPSTHTNLQIAFLMPINGTLKKQNSHDNSIASSIIPGPIFKPEIAESDMFAKDELLKGVIQTDESAIPANVDSPLVIDNDAEKSTSLTKAYEWQGIPDSEGKTQIQTGACFPVSLISEISSQSAKIGDPIQGRLSLDIKIGGRMIAQKGAMVNGHISSVSKARKMLAAELNPHRWMRASGALGIQFDEIVTTEGTHIPLVATPARRALIVKNKNEGRVLGVNDKGEVTAPLSGQLKAQALHVAIRAGASAGGVFSFGAVPVAFGVIGAINPSFAFMHPVGQNVPHRRLKGFAMGVASGLPGGFLIADSIIKGQECIIKPGDEFLAEFKQDFTGETLADAELLGNPSTKVHGQIMPEHQEKI